MERRTTKAEKADREQLDWEMLKRKKMKWKAMA